MKQINIQENPHECLFKDGLGRYKECLICGKEKPPTTDLQIENKAKKTKTVAIDFDGVIHGYSKGWHDGTCYDKPLAEAFDRIQDIMDDYNVYILSTRNPFQIADWLEVHKAPFKFEVIPLDTELTFWNKHWVVGITQKKLAAMLYIDDRGLRFTGWNNVPRNLDAYV